MGRRSGFFSTSLVWFVNQEQQWQQQASNRRIDACKLPKRKIVPYPKSKRSACAIAIAVCQPTRRNVASRMHACMAHHHIRSTVLYCTSILYAVQTTQNATIASQHHLRSRQSPWRMAVAASLISIDRILNS